MRIGIDIDDTTVPLVQSYYPYAVEHFGYYPRKELSDFTDYAHSTVCNLTPDEVRECFRKFYLTPEFASLKPYVNAIIAIRQLMQNGEEVYFITSRDDSTYPQTKKQLSHIDESIDHRRIYFAKHKFNGDSHTKEDIAQALSLDHFVDDLSDHVERVSAKGIHSILFDQPWNRKSILPKNAERAYSWPYAMAAIYDEEKLFRYLANHPLTNVLPLYTFKANKRKQLLIPPSAGRYQEYIRGNKENEDMMDLSIDGGKWSDILVFIGIASAVALSPCVLNSAKDGAKELLEYASSFHYKIIDGMRHSIF